MNNINLDPIPRPDYDPRLDPRNPAYDPNLDPDFDPDFGWDGREFSFGDIVTDIVKECRMHPACFARFAADCPFFCACSRHDLTGDDLRAALFDAWEERELDAMGG